MDNSLKHAIKWSLAGKLATQLITWSIAIFTIRLLTPDDYGLFALSVIFIVLFDLLSEMGLGQSIIQSNEVSEKTIKNINGLIIAINFAIAIIIISIAPAIAFIIDEPRVTPIIQFIALQFIIGSFAIVPRSLMIKMFIYDKKETIGFFKNTISGAVTLYLAYSDFGAWSIAIGNMVGIFIMTAGFLYFSPVKFSFGIDISHTSQHLRFGGNIILQRFLWWFYTRAEVFILKSFMSTSAVGVYSAAKGLLMIPQDKIGAIIAELTLATFSKIKEQPEKVEENLTRTLSVLTMFTFPLYFGISAVSDPFVRIVLGDVWLDSIIPLSILAFAFPIRFANSVISEVLNAVGAPKRQVKNLVITCVTMIPTIIFSAQWGVLGVSLGSVIGYTFNFIIINNLSSKYTKVTNLIFLKTVYWQLLSAATMVISVKTFMHHSSLCHILELIIGVFLGAIVYIACCLIICRGEFTVNLALVKSIKKKG